MAHFPRGGRRAVPRWVENLIMAGLEAKFPWFRGVIYGMYIDVYYVLLWHLKIFFCCFCLWLELTAWPSLIELNELWWSWIHIMAQVWNAKGSTILCSDRCANIVMSNDFSMMVDIAPFTISITRRVRRLFTVDFPLRGSGTLQVVLKFSGAEGWERSHQRSKGARELRVDGWKRYSREV